LVVDARVGHDGQSGFLDRARDDVICVCERAWGEASCDGLGTGVGGVFEDGAMAVWSRGDHANVVVGVLDGGNNPRGKDELLPCPSDVNDVGYLHRKKKLS